MYVARAHLPSQAQVLIGNGRWETVSVVTGRTTVEVCRRCSRKLNVSVEGLARTQFFYSGFTQGLQYSVLNTVMSNLARRMISCR